MGIVPDMSPSQNTGIIKPTRNHQHNSSILLRKSLNMILTRFNKISIQGTPQMAVDKEARPYRESTHIVITRRVPVQRAIERDEIPYP